MYLVRRLRELSHQPTDKLLAARYEKFRRMGVFLEGDVSAASAAATSTAAATSSVNGNGQPNGQSGASSLTKPAITSPGST